jgi:hypothetical protein
MGMKDFLGRYIYRSKIISFIYSWLVSTIIGLEPLQNVDLFWQQSKRINQNEELLLASMFTYLVAEKISSKLSMASLIGRSGSTPPSDWSDGCALKHPSKAVRELNRTSSPWQWRSSIEPRGCTCTRVALVFTLQLAAKPVYAPL